MTFWRIASFVAGISLAIFAGSLGINVLLQTADPFWELGFQFVLLLGVLPALAGGALAWRAYWGDGIDPNTGLNRQYHSPSVTIVRYILMALGGLIVVTMPGRMISIFLSNGEVDGGFIVFAIWPAIFGGILMLIAHRFGRW